MLPGFQKNFLLITMFTCVKPLSLVLIQSQAIILLVYFNAVVDVKFIPPAIKRN